MGKDQGQDSRDDGQRHIKGNFCRTELRFPCRGDGADKRFTRKHGYVCKNFRVHAESQDQTSDQKVDHRGDITLRINEEEQHHGQIDEIPEQDRNRYLQQVLCFKVSAQDNKLDQDQQKAEGNRELSQCKRKVQAEHIGD